MTTRRIIAATLAGHFAAALAALGMPPFYDRILRDALHSDAVWLAGWFFVIPTLLAALSNPWWGALADRYGKKRLLLRAHLGLAVSFWLTSLSDNVWQFGAALALQGILGGTFAASNAYLATVVSGHRLTRLLTLMQGSARAALFAGPALLGVLAQSAQPLLIIRWLALLPLASALLVWRLPAAHQTKASLATAAMDTTDATAAPPGTETAHAIGDTTAATNTAATAAANAGHPTQPAAVAESITPRHVYALQFAFIFGTVITFPYFVPFAERALNDLPAAAPGLLFGLPHLAYLFCALPMSRHLGKNRLLATLLASQLLLIATLLGQAYCHNVPALIVLRTVMGIAITASYIALHGLVAAITDASNAGRRFGSLEAATKWGAVAAGVTADTLPGVSLRAREALWYGRAAGWQRIAYCLFVNNFCEAIHQLAAGQPAVQQRLWDIVRHHLQRYQTEYGCAESTPRIAAVLAGQALPGKGNLSNRFLKQADRAADYAPFANPFTAGRA